ncbi:hypothetical protein V6N11_077470 [Hibiscus sabdariffa]|uniref:Serine/threonine-protein kinase BSK1-like TPR repeats domain-containing protein n=1 Tax=Hibiscus sabdariffa TaxID=183260 RepID=A0ABR2TD56_9ROSI
MDYLSFIELAYELDAEGDLTEKIASGKDENGINALHVAALGGQTHVLKYLVGELKLDVNVKDDEGKTPLIWATAHKHFPSAVYLIDSGANLNAMNNQGCTVLHFAATGPKKLLKVLISRGADVDAKPAAVTPLQFAVRDGKSDCVKVLLENNANLNTNSDDDICLLMLAIAQGSMECLTLLLKAGADPNISSTGLRPLDLAAYKGDTEIIKCLLTAGADPNVPNDVGLAPIEVMAIHGNRDGVMALYPLTSAISDYPVWSVDGIMVHTHPKEKMEKVNQQIQRLFMESKLKGTEAFKKMDYLGAIKWYTEAISYNKTDATVYSNRSLCWARLEDGKNALVDAGRCVMLSPLWPKSYYRLGVAWKLLQEFDKAADAFYNGWVLDRKNKELECAYRDAVDAQRKHG